MTVLVMIALGITVLAFAMTMMNLPLLKAGVMGGRTDPNAPAALSVCIPARDEEANIRGVLESVLGQELPEGVRLEALVYDDESSDRTPEILAELAAGDDRLRTVQTSPMPGGWSGKMWACAQLADAAQGDLLLFIDADVRLVQGGLGKALEQIRGRASVGLVSCFPRQITGTLAEKLVVPMIHFLLLSYLPFPQMKMTTAPSASAGCGQFILVRRQAYREAGGHAAVRATMHDGIKLTRNVRRSGYRTDVFDGIGVAECRMYRGMNEVWPGFVKNAYEGLGSPVLLVFLTVLHAVGHVLPWVYVVVSGAGWLIGLWSLDPVGLPLAGAAVLIHLVHRSVLAAAFDQAWQSVVLHPVGVTLMTVIQWASFAAHVRGTRAWRGRTLQQQ